MIKKDNKGFTLIELLATIVILSLILVVAIPSVNAVVGIVKRGQKNNVIKNIEANASRYAFDTGETLFFVDDLVMYGYMDVDKDVINPVNNTRMNCYGIKAEKKGNYYIANLLDTEYVKNGKCDRNKLLDSYSINTIKSSVSEIKNGEWVKTSVTSLKLTAEGANCGSGYTCSWFTPNGEKKTGNNVTINLANSQKVINLRYTFQQINHDDVEAKNSYFNILIDNELPTIDKASSYYDSTTKEYVIIANDGVGSGIQGYCISPSSNQSTCSKFYTSNRLAYQSSSGFYIYVQDNAGNVSSLHIT